MNNDYKNFKQLLEYFVAPPLLARACSSCLLN